MATSEAMTACRPSRPLMPIPTWAACIMGTSLAPSPIARVEQLRASFIIFTTRAFCFGDTRQQTVAEHLVHNSKKSSRSSSCVSSKTKVRVGPSMMTPRSREAPISLASSVLSWSLHSSNVSALMILNSISSLSRAQLVPMLMAVSCLSPVSIHTLIPACVSAEIASGTPSCSLSSMAVAPSKMRFFSKRAAASSIFSSLSTRETAASL
mmetsp:Transcript_18807/g.45094  ORF Transcript_18807/g.45094 Transcript_18807/m.45094 type:complete len:209 (-) Transcript_18807:187-813(-)